MYFLKVFIKLIWKLINLFLKFSPEKKEEWEKFEKKIRSSTERSRFLKGLLSITERFFFRKYFKDDRVFLLLSGWERVLLFSLLSLALLLIFSHPIITWLKPYIIFNNNPIPAPSIFLSLFSLVLSVSLILSYGAKLPPLLSGVIFLLLLYPMVIFFEIIIPPRVSSILLLSLFIYIIFLLSASSEQKIMPRVGGALILLPFISFLFLPLFPKEKKWLLVIVFLVLSFFPLIVKKKIKLPFFPILILSFPLIFLFFFFHIQINGMKSFHSSLLQFLTWLFNALAPLWYYIGVGIIFKLIKHARTVTNAFQEMFSEKIFKFIFYAFILFVVLAWTENFLPISIITSHLHDKFHFSLEVMGYISLFLLGYLFFLFLFKEYSKGIEEKLFYIFVLVFFVIYEYYFELFSFKSSLFNKIGVYVIVSFSIIFLLLRIGLKSIGNSKELQNKGKSYLFSLVGGLLIMSLYFHTFYISGTHTAIQNLFLYFFLGIIQAGFPFVIYVLWAKEKGLSYKKLLTVFILGVIAAITGEFVRKTVDYGGINNLLYAAKNEGVKFQSLPYTLNGILAFVLVSLLISFTFIWFYVRKKQNRESVVLIAVFLFSGAAAGTFYSLGFPFLPSYLDLLMTSSRKFLFFDSISILTYIAVLSPAAILALFFRKRFDNNSFFKWAVVFIISFLTEAFFQMLIIKHQAFLYMNSLGWKILLILALLVLLLSIRPSRVGKSLPYTIRTSFAIVLLIFFNTLYSERTIIHSIFGEKVKLPAAYKLVEKDMRKFRFARIQRRIPVFYVSIYNCKSHSPSEFIKEEIGEGFKPLKITQWKNYMFFLSSLRSFLNLELFTTSENMRKCVSINFNKEIPWSSFELKRVLTKNFDLSPEEKNFLSK